MKINKCMILVSTGLFTLGASAMNVQVKFLKSNNVTTEKTTYSKTELKSREYEVSVSRQASETNSYKVVVGTVVSSASAKGLFLIMDTAECVDFSKNGKKDKYTVETCSVIATKDNARGSYGIDLNSGYQIDGIIVEVQALDGTVVKRKTTSDTKYKKLQLSNKENWVQNAISDTPFEKKTRITWIDPNAKKTLNR